MRMRLWSLRGRGTKSWPFDARSAGIDFCSAAPVSSRVSSFTPTDQNYSAAKSSMTFRLQPGEVCYMSIDTAARKLTI
jgi:hypothetical protein